MLLLRRLPYHLCTTMPAVRTGGVRLCRQIPDEGLLTALALHGEPEVQLQRQCLATHRPRQESPPVGPPSPAPLPAPHCWRATIVAVNACGRRQDAGNRQTSMHIQIDVGSGSTLSMLCVASWLCCRTDVDVALAARNTTFTVNAGWTTPRPRPRPKPRPQTETETTTPQL